MTLDSMLHESLKQFLSHLSEELLISISGLPYSQFCLMCHFHYEDQVYESYLSEEQPLGKYLSSLGMYDPRAKLDFFFHSLFLFLHANHDQ